MPWWGIAILASSIGLLLGVCIGAVVSYRLIMKRLRDNPPINEDVIKVLYAQLSGRSLRETQVKQIMSKIREEQQRSGASFI